MNAMIERIRASSRRQRAFVADAAHELRSPLASIRTSVEVGRLHPDAADWPDIADGVLEDAGRMSRLVDDLLLLARLDEGRLATAAPAGADAAAVANDVVERLGRQVPEGVRLTRTGVQAAGAGAARDAIDRITVNLVENALRYAHSRVEVCVDERDGQVLVVVTDDGPGIPADDRERVFERFTRLDDDRSRASGGSGLGLAIVHELARGAGGAVHLEDAGPGLRAVVSLPVTSTAGAPRRSPSG
jgi:signal transduction histidine kinase